MNIPFGNNLSLNDIIATNLENGKIIPYFDACILQDTYIKYEFFTHTYYKFNKKFHRVDGPAIVYNFDISNNEWWYFGEKINCSSQEEFEKLIKMKVFW